MITGLEAETSVRKALAILDCYRGGKSELGVSEVSRRTSIAKSTVFRLCNQLADAGYLAKTEHRAFTLSLGLFELGNRAVAPIYGGQDASRFLHRLSAVTGETTHLAVLDGPDVVYLDKIQTLRSEDVPSRVGQRNPAYCTAIGKVLLAWSRGALEQLAAAGPRLEAFTPNTITRLDVLRDELNEVRSADVAFDREERNVGVSCVAAPVRNRSGSVIAAVSVAGPAARSTQERSIQIAHVVRQAAYGLSKQLGWVPRRPVRAS